MPNLTIGAPVVKSLRAHLASTHLDVHLMVSEPARWVADFSAAGASSYTFHLESVEGAAAVRGLVAAVRAAGMLAGVALKPGTPVEAVLPYAGDVDLVLVMTVEPGFGGQSFMPETLAKVTTLRAAFPDLNIQVGAGRSRRGRRGVRGARGSRQSQTTKIVGAAPLPFCGVCMCN